VLINIQNNFLVYQNLLNSTNKSGFISSY